MKNEERSMAIKNMLMGNKAAIIVLLLILCLSFASPVFLTWSNLLNVAPDLREYAAIHWVHGGACLR